jgi:hypothetical protein
MGVGMWVENKFDAVLLVEDATQLVGARDQVGPLFRIHFCGLEHLSGVQVGVLLRQQDQIFRSNLLEQPGFLAKLVDRLGESRC